MYLWNTLESVPESSFELGGCGRQPEGAGNLVYWYQTDVGQKLKNLRNHRCVWRDWGTSAVKIRPGGIEGRANSGGRRNSCREVHWGRVVAGRGMEVLGMMDLLLGEEAVWKQWEKTQYSYGRKWGVWAVTVPETGMRRLQSLGSSCCMGCGRAGWIKKWPRAFLTVFLIHGMTGTYSRMQYAAVCFLIQTAISTLSSSFIVPDFLTSSVSVWWCCLVLCVAFFLALLDSYQPHSAPETSTSKNLGVWWFWFFFNLWGCGPVVFLVLIFTNQAKFREMLFLPALHCSYWGCCCDTGKI